MKKLIAFFAFAFLLAAARAALPQPDLIAQIHFAGGQNISAAPDFSAFTNEFTSAEARALAGQTFDKLARAPYTWFRAKVAPGAIDGAAQLRPLLDDLLASEWYFAARDTKNGPEYALAIHLSADRAQLWSKNLQTLLQSWTRIKVLNVAFETWLLKKHEPPDLFQFSRAGEWVILDCGENKLTLSDKILPAKNTIADTNWLSADINWPRLNQLFPRLFSLTKTMDWPETKLAVSARNKNLHVNGDFFFAQNLSSGLPDWRLPTNTVHEPFVSFTAARGIASWLAACNWYRPYAISPTPNQLFIWALAGLPFQTFAAVPVQNASGALTQTYARLNPVFNSPQARSELFAPFKLALTNNQIRLTGVPFAAPYLQAVSEPAGQFLLAGAFPNTPRGKPLPPELFARLAEKNIVFYHWEITAERFPQLLNLTQLGLVLTERQQLEGKSAGMKWLRKITPKLGNTVTEVFQTAPDRMSFVRSAPGGLTAFEFLALANWLEAKNFPGCDLKMPPRPKVRPNFHRRAPTVPAPAKPH